MGAYTGSGPTDPVVGNKVSVTNFGVPTSDAVQALASSWSSYTPSWTGSVTNPVIGNGTLTGAYTQVGKLVTFRVVGTTGSSTTFGSGAYSISLPVAAVSGVEQLVTAMAFDTSTGYYYRGIGRIDPGATTVTRSLFTDGVGGAGGWTTAVPFTWAISGDKFWFQGTYEAA